MTPAIPDKRADADNPGLGCVGAWFKEAREKRGETLENVSRVTRIGKNYLEAIEEGAAARLPSSAYTRGFIRLYAAHLGLSPEHALSLLGERQAEPGESRDPSPPPAPTPSPSGPALHRGTTTAVIIGILLLGLLLFRPSPPIQTEATRTIPAPPTALKPAQPAGPVTKDPMPPSPAPATTSDTAGSPLPRKDGIVLRLKAVSDGRIHITIDGSITQEYDLVSGDLVEWKADTSIALDLENAASVEGEVDNRRLEPFGEPGTAAHLLLTADGIRRN